MIRSTYRRARAARRAAVRIIRDRIAGLQAVALIRAVRKLNGYVMTTALARGELVTVSQILAALGADADFIRRYASHAGKKIKAALGKVPVMVWKVIHGKPRQVAAYTPTHPAIREGLAAYPRTAHLVNA